MKTIEEVKNWLEAKKVGIINPDDWDWDELLDNMGFDDKLEEELARSYGTPAEYMENSDEFDFDEGQQMQIQLIEELLSELKVGDHDHNREDRY